MQQIGKICKSWPIWGCVYLVSSASMLACNGKHDTEGNPFIHVYLHSIAQHLVLFFIWGKPSHPNPYYWINMQCWEYTTTGSRVCVQGITDHQNVRGVHVELYGSPVTLVMLWIHLIPHTSSNNFQMKPSICHVDYYSLPRGQPEHSTLTVYLRSKDLLCSPRCYTSIQSVTVHLLLGQNGWANSFWLPTL